MTLSVLLPFKPHANIIVIIHLVKYKLITGGYNTNCNVMTLVINFFLKIYLCRRACPGTLNKQAQVGIRWTWIDIMQN